MSSEICNIRARVYVPRALSSFVDTDKILERSFWNCVHFLVQQLKLGARYFAPNGIPRIHTCADRVRACCLIVRVHSAITRLYLSALKAYILPPFQPCLKEILKKLCILTY